MPTYEYQCQKCDNIEEEMRPVSNRNDVKYCSKCNFAMVKLISGGDRFIFKGPGFYEHEKQLAEAKKKWDIK